MPSTPPPPPRQSFFDRFRGLAWWELVLVLIPLGLVILGGLVGGVIGAIALLSNLAIARRPMAPGIKVAAMIGIIFVAYIAVIVIVAIIYAATHKT
jgi:hypothetical protein